MLRFGVVAAVLACTGAFLANQGHSSAAHAAIQHTCGLTDRQFLSNYQVQLAEVGVYGDDYLKGNASADDVISAAQSAAKIVRSSAPFDPSLQLVKKYAPAMFMQYGNAIQARDEGRSAAREMYLAYSIGARVEDALRDAEPGLTAAGCDVSDVLQ
jgi:hypothetical protein